MKRSPSLVGQRFNRWLVTGDAPNRGKLRMYLCVCDCGVEREVYQSILVSGQSGSCGCYRTDRLVAHNLTHGQSGSPFYPAWIRMVGRCTDPTDGNYHNYGGRGIKVCDAWINSPEQFAKDVGPKPGPGYTIDRKDNNGNYEPGNVKWSTQIEQCQNMRKNVRVVFNGQSRTLADWARTLMVPPSTIYVRIKRGRTPEEAVKISFEQQMGNFREMSMNQYSEVMYGNN